MQISLYKANDTIKKLGNKLAVQSKKNIQLNRMSNYYKDKCDKLRTEHDRTEVNVVHLIFQISPEGCMQIMFFHFQNDLGEIIDCLTGKTKLKFTTAVREFALTIDHYSATTYRYIRNKFNRSLPHPSTLRKYYVNSGANGEPGLSTDGIRSLSTLVKQSQDTGKKFYCSLTFDEMFIRRHVQYIDAQKKFQGFVTFAGNEDCCPIPVAQFAIVFMINGINKDVSIPVAHHFITSLKKEPKSDLLLSVITAVTETGAIIMNVTCDGSTTNFSMFRHLGASFKLDDLKPYFRHPVNGNRIFIMFDACHMLKLVRNCILKHGSIVDSDNQTIKWKHFQRLERVRVKNDFIRHKLTKKHIDCHRNKMNVALAAQTLSRSVAKALEFLMESVKFGFIDCEGTINFARQFNDLFDILNAGHNDDLENNNNNKFKIPLSQKTAQYVLPFLDRSVEYIKSLKLAGTNILKSPKKTGFLGFIIDIKVLKLVYEEYIAIGELDQIPTFNMSQDPLESFFGRVRSKCGNNDNPTVEQFKSAYRKILVNKEIAASIHANCKDKLNIFFVSSTGNIKASQAETELDELHVDIDTADPFTYNDNVLDAYEEATVCQIASDIEKKIRLMANFQCEFYMNVLNENEKVSIDIFEKEEEQFRPCISTVFICRVAKKYLDIFKNKIAFDYARLIITIKKQMRYKIMFEGSDFSSHCDHKEYLVNYIIEEFIRIRATYIARDLTMNEYNKVLKHRLNKKMKLRG